MLGMRKLHDGAAMERASNAILRVDERVLVAAAILVVELILAATWSIKSGVDAGLLLQIFRWICVRRATCALERRADPAKTAELGMIRRLIIREMLLIPKGLVAQFRVCLSVR